MLAYIVLPNNLLFRKHFACTADGQIVFIFLPDSIFWAIFNANYLLFSSSIYNTYTMYTMYTSITQQNTNIFYGVRTCADVFRLDKVFAHHL